MSLRSPHPHLTPVLVGREEEMKRGLAFYESNKDKGGLLLVEGSRGVGRSRFLDDLISNIRDKGEDITVWQTRGRGTERHPLHPFRAVLPWREMIMEARTNFPTADIPEMEERYLLFNAAVKHFETLLSENPGIVILDDLHLCDEMSIYLLHYLLLSHIPLVVLSSVCSEYIDAKSPLGQTLALMNRERLVTTVGLRPLTKDDLERMTSNMLGRMPGDDVLYRIWMLSEGNPSVAVQTLQEFISKGYLVFRDSAWEFSSPSESIPFPETLEALAMERLTSLSPNERYMLTIGAVLGPVFSFRALACMSRMDAENGEECDGDCEKASKAAKPAAGTDEDVLIDTLESLMNKGILIQGEEGEGEWSDEDYSFSMGLLYRATYDSIPHEEKIKYHRQAAEALESIVGKDRRKRDFLLPVIARHYSLGGEESRALPLFIGAGKRMEALSAFVDAKKLYGMAVSLLEKGPAISDQLYAQCLLDAGRMSLITDDVDSARTHLERSVALSRKAGLRKMEVEGRIYLDELLLAHEKYQEAERSCLATLQDAVLLGDLGHIGWCFERLGNIYWLLGRLEIARESLENGLSYTMATGDLIMGERITADLGAVLASKGEYKLALARYSVAMSMLEQRPNRYEETRVFLGMGRTMLLSSSTQDALDMYSKALESATSIGALRMQTMAHYGLAEAYLEMGYVNKAEEHVFKALDTVVHSRRIDLVRAYRIKGVIASLRWQTETAENLLMEALDLADEIGIIEEKARVMFSLGTVLVNTGDVKRGNRLFDKAGSIYTIMGNEVMEKKAADSIRT